MFPVALLIPLCQDAHGQLENVQLGDAGTRVAQGGRGSGIHGQGGNFGNGVPAGGAYACGRHGLVMVMELRLGTRRLITYLIYPSRTSEPRRSGSIVSLHL